MQTEPYYMFWNTSKIHTNVISMTVRYCGCCRKRPMEWTEQYTRGSKESSQNYRHRRFSAPWVRTVWTKCYWSFLLATFAQIARCNSEEAAWQVAGRDSGFCIIKNQRATHIVCCAAISRWENHSCHHPTTLISGSRSEWLFFSVLYSENGP
jgi:hypothetical protein